MTDDRMRPKLFDFFIIIILLFLNQIACVSAFYY